MSGCAVIFKSKYGSTKKYAQWIAEKLNADIYESDKVKIEKLNKYDTLIFGGGLYAGGIAGFSILKNNFEILNDKKIVLFTVGLANPKTTDYTALHQKNLTDEMLEKIKIFNLRGGIDYSKLSIIHKAMMKMLKTKIQSTPKEKLTDEDKYFLETYGKKVHFENEDAITELVKYCS